MDNPQETKIKYTFLFRILRDYTLYSINIMDEDIVQGNLTITIK